MYQQKYGNIKGVCHGYPFTDISAVASKPSVALTADVPSFVRLNQTFGDKAASSWLFAHLKPLLANFLVDKKKMANEQIEFLASIIASNYPSMKLTEFMLFESYFLGGRYAEFYGDTSYILAITRSLQSFKKDLNTIYWQIERDKQNAIMAADTAETHVTWEQYCKSKGMEGKPYPGTIKEEPVKVRRVVKKPSILTEIQVGVNSAHAVIDNIYHFDKNGLASLREVFRKRYGCTPENYLELHEIVVEENGGQNTVIS